MPDRIEREIEDILNKLDDFVPEKGNKPIPFRQRRKPAQKSQLSQRLSHISLNQIMLGALLVGLFAFMVRSIPFSNWIMLASMLTLFGAFLLSVKAGRSGRGSIGGGTTQQRWRGEPLDLRTQQNYGPTIGDRIVGWFKRKK